jgi:LmbE family N-acetylglucosaminyl deacetylase
MAKLSNAGVRVVVCQFTDGCEGYPRPEWRDQIVEMRRREADACDQVLGVAKRYHMGRPDMGLVNDKETFLEAIRIIREVRPDAVFSHGPEDFHRDHIATCEIALEAAWQAGEPVCAQMGAPWKTPHVFFYKGIRTRLPDIIYDVSEFAHKVPEALAVQESQHTLFGRGREEFLAEAHSIKQAVAQGRKYTETFWFTDRCHLNDFPPL